MSNSNVTVDALRRLTSRFDTTADELNDFTWRHAMGEKPDPNEFMRILETRTITQKAMEAQFNLHEQPLKTVLNESGR